jgi:hypothetical protein
MAGDRGDGAVRAEGVFDQPGSREVVGAEQLRMWIAETGLVAVSVLVPLVLVCGTFHCCAVYLIAHRVSELTH